jgi:hypothetical protein
LFKTQCSDHCELALELLASQKYSWADIVRGYGLDCQGLIHCSGKNIALLHMFIPALGPTSLLSIGVLRLFTCNKVTRE